MLNSSLFNLFNYLRRLLLVRNRLYELLAHLIPPDEIVRVHYRLPFHTDSFWILTTFNCLCSLADSTLRAASFVWSLDSRPSGGVGGGVRGASLLWRGTAPDLPLGGLCGSLSRALQALHWPGPRPTRPTLRLLTRHITLVFLLQYFVYFLLV